MEPHLKLWLEESGRLTMSDYRARLLRHVRDSGSLAYAATAMGLSYRRAWGKVRELEQHLGFAVVRSDVGGLGGGKSRLTDQGAWLLDRYEAFQAACEAAVRQAYTDCFVEEAMQGLAATGGPLREARQQIEPIADDAVHAPADELRGERRFVDRPGK